MSSPADDFENVHARRLQPLEGADSASGGSESGRIALRGIVLAAMTEIWHAAEGIEGIAMEA